MRFNFDTCLSETLSHEGGWANHPKDPGGATMQGVTQRTYDAYRRAKKLPTQSVRNVSRDELKDIYYSRYWAVVMADSLPSGIDLVTFDASVNSGTGRGPKWTQRAVGVPQDGKVGSVTIRAAKEHPDHVRVVQDACKYRMGFLRGLSHWSTFGTGWSRRVASIEAVASRMAGADRKRLKETAGGAAKLQKRETTAAGASGGGGLGGFTIPDIPTEALIVAGIVFAVAVAVFVKRAMHEREREKAFEAQVKEVAV